MVPTELRKPALSTPKFLAVRFTLALLSVGARPQRPTFDFFPFMKYFPNWIAKWKRDGLAWHKAETEMFEGFNAGVAQKLVSGRLNC